MSATSNKELDDVLNRVRAEVFAATAMWAPFNSQHEGFAVLDEELDEVIEQRDELWVAVKVNQKRRDLAATKEIAEKLAAEAVQVAAMAVRFAMDVCDEVNGRK